MAQVIADSNEMRAFAAHLKKFSQELQAQHASTKGKLGQLGQTWRDQDFTKFVEHFHQSSQPIAKLIAEMEAYAIVLQRRAQHLDDIKKISF